MYSPASSPFSLRCAAKLASAICLGQPRFITLVLALTLGAAAAIAAQVPRVQPALSGQPEVTHPSDPRIDAATGQQLAIWPRPRHFDHLAMTLELDIPDMSKATLFAHQTITMRAQGGTRSVVTLACAGPQIRQIYQMSKITADKLPCQFTLIDKELRIELARPVLEGELCTLSIHYDLEYAANRGNGLTYSAAIPGTTSLTRASPQIHAQGQAQLNSLWFPCHDFPNERLSSRLIVTVETGFDVISNGRLISATPVAETSGTGRTRWEWFQEQPHAPYLVTLVIGKLATINLNSPPGNGTGLGGPHTASPGVPLTVHTPYGTEESVTKIYSATGEMLRFFEQRFDEPYPWDRYAQCIVRDFNAGGMENTSCTLMTISSSKGEPGSHDDLISHELAHQWFGNLVTCNSWEHIWLNEGWASFAEALWNEHVGAKISKEKAKAAYQKTIRGFFASQRLRNKSEYPAYTPMVSNRYTNPDSIFSKPEDPYAKGALVLHMLRQRLGDDAFFKGSVAYLDRFRLRTVETDDFRRSLEEASGQSLERFFDQWVLRPGLPRLSVQLTWNEAESKLNVVVAQTQTINRLNPAFALQIPLRLKMSDGTVRWEQIDCDSRTTTASFDVPEKPVQVSVDPNMTLIAPTEISKDLAWWMNEAEFPPSYAAAAEAELALRRAGIAR